MTKNNSRINTIEILDEIIAIQSDNQFLNYIVNRIQDGNYRGIHISQHNRYDLDRLTKILAGINEVVADKIFRVPPGDDKKGEQKPDCAEYYSIVKSVKNVAGVGTINSLKKNFFVDFQKLGLLHRFDKNKNEITKRSGIYYAQLTSLAIKLVNSSLVQQYKIFTDALDDLFEAEITRLAETLYYSNYKDTPIGIIEFMLILSDDRPQMSDNKIDLINSYRALKSWQRKKVINLIKEYCNPKNFRGDKTKKRDFGNWKNESQQIFSLLKNTVYFDITQNSLKLNTGMYGIFTDIQIKRRSLGAKHEYFQQHKIKKKIPTFELHHVIPFSVARNKMEFGLIDHWKNLVYLKNNKHAELTKNRDKNIVLYATEKELDFDDFNKKRIIAKNGSTVVYVGNLFEIMQKYNRDILKEVFDYTI
ncbi:MAG: hypothetical protein V1891_04840 [bacterium]